MAEEQSSGLHKEGKVVKLAFIAGLVFPEGKATLAARVGDSAAAAAAAGAAPPGFEVEVKTLSFSPISFLLFFFSSFFFRSARFTRHGDIGRLDRGPGRRFPVLQRPSAA